MSGTLKELRKNHRDIQGKDIFHDPTLCAQFLRNNVNHPLVKKVQPEDIEDYTEHFIPYFGVEFEGDVIKRICIKDDNEEYVFYLISLIEHKSRVDYNVTIQLLKYMVCIWIEYERQFGENFKRRIRNKTFRYPPILPIVYYEGKAAWTAGRHLRDRVQFSEVFAEYIPDFTYELVNIHEISNKELLERKDIMSLIMLLNKIQTSAELSLVKELPTENIADLVKEAPEQLVDILVSVIRTLCKRINATEEETENCVAIVRTGNMGYLFENMEPMDIQAERKNTAEAREERDLAREERDLAREERDLAKEELGRATEQLGKKDARIQELEELLKKHNISE